MGLGKVKWPPGRYAYLRLFSTDLCDYMLFNARSSARWILLLLLSALMVAFVEGREDRDGVREGGWLLPERAWLGEQTQARSTRGEV